MSSFYLDVLKGQALHIQIRLCREARCPMGPRSDTFCNDEAYGTGPFLYSGGGLAEPEAES